MSTARDNQLLLHRPYMVTKQPWYKDKMFYLNLIRRSLAEFLGTGLFVFTSVSAAALSKHDDEGWANLAVSIGLAQGLAYGALVAAMMHVR